MKQKLILHINCYIPSAFSPTPISVKKSTDHQTPSMTSTMTPRHQNAYNYNAFHAFHVMTNRQCPPNPNNEFIKHHQIITWVCAPSPPPPPQGGGGVVTAHRPMSSFTNTPKGL